MSYFKFDVLCFENDLFCNKYIQYLLICVKCLNVYICYYTLLHVCKCFEICDCEICVCLFLSSTFSNVFFITLYLYLITCLIWLYIFQKRLLWFRLISRVHAFLKCFHIVLFVTKYFFTFELFWWFHVFSYINFHM